MVSIVTSLSLAGVSLASPVRMVTCAIGCLAWKG